MLQYIVGSLQKLAATRDLAVVVLTQCATKMQAERGATLIPAINASVWEQGMSTRLVLFRDWLQEEAETHGRHFAVIQKLHGKGTPALIESACPFRVDEVSTEARPGLQLLIPVKRGLVSVEYDSTQQSRTVTSTPAQKRKLGETDFEIADSDDEEYGWDDDEELPPMPSQWQGSEDILLTRNPESDEDDHQDGSQSPGAVESKRQEPDDTESASEATTPAGEPTP